MDRHTVLNKLIDFGCSEFPEEKRMSEIICTKSYKEFLLKLLITEEFKWLTNKEEKGNNYYFVNGIRATIIAKEYCKIPIFYFSNRYTYKDNRISPTIKVFYDNDLEAVVIINKFINN